MQTPTSSTRNLSLVRETLDRVETIVSSSLVGDDLSVWNMEDTFFSSNHDQKRTHGLAASSYNKTNQSNAMDLEPTPIGGRIRVVDRLDTQELLKSTCSSSYQAETHCHSLLELLRPLTSPNAKCPPTSDEGFLQDSLSSFGGDLEDPLPVDRIDGDSLSVWPIAQASRATTFNHDYEWNMGHNNNHLLGNNQAQLPGRRQVASGMQGRVASRQRGLASSSCGGSKSSTSFPRTFAEKRQDQEDLWMTRYQELVEFKNTYGHCSVPCKYGQNAALAQWVKRQRYQNKLMEEGKHSAMTPERKQMLVRLGFCWDSHKSAWMERFDELVEYKEQHGDCNVPTRYAENYPLAVWVKCQRRQEKLRRRNQKSNMTQERLDLLNSLGFVWNPRNLSDY